MYTWFKSKNCILLHCIDNIIDKLFYRNCRVLRVFVCLARSRGRLSLQKRYKAKTFVNISDETTLLQL